MNKKQLILVAFVCAILIACGAALLLKDANKWESGPEASRAKLLPDFEINAVAKVALQDKGDKTVVTKVDEKWQVEGKSGYPADFDKVKNALLGLSELSVARREEVGPSQMGRLELLKPGEGEASGTLVECFSQDGKKLLSLLLGKPHLSKAERNPSPYMGMMGGGEQPDGRYVAVLGGKTMVALVSDPLRALVPGAAAWLDKEFLKMPDVKSIELLGKDGWKLSRQDKAGKFAVVGVKAGEEEVADKVGELGREFGYFYFSDVSPDSGLAADAKARKLVVETFDGFKYDLAVVPGSGKAALTVRVAAELPKARQAGKDEKPEAKAKLDQEFADAQAKLKERFNKEKFFEKWAFVIPEYKASSLLKKRSDLVQKKGASESKAMSKPAGKPMKK